MGTTISTQRHQDTKVLYGFLCVFVTWWFIPLLRGKPLILGNDLDEVWALKDVSFREPARGI